MKGKGGEEEIRMHKQMLSKKLVTICVREKKIPGRMIENDERVILLPDLVPGEHQAHTKH